MRDVISALPEPPLVLLAVERRPVGAAQLPRLRLGEEQTGRLKDSQGGHGSSSPPMGPLSHST